MKKLFVIIFAFVLLSCSEKKLEEAPKPLSIKDDMGYSVDVSNSPNKIVTLAPNLTEMVYALNGEDKLIGNTLYCNYPEAAKNVNKVGDLLTIDYEKLLTLKPDMIILTVEGNNKETYDKLKSLGFNLFVSNPRDYDGIKKSLKDIANLIGKKSIADSLITLWDKDIETVISKTSRADSAVAMFTVALKPLMLAGATTFINEYFKLCSIINAASLSEVNYPIWSREEVIKQNPDYIIIPDGNVKTEKELLRIFPEWKKLKAVTNGNILFVDADLYFRPGPRFIDALKDFSDRL